MRNRHLLIILFMILGSETLLAAEVSAVLVDQEGEPLDDAVLYLHAVNGEQPQFEPAESTIDQVDKAFVPHVRVVTRNSSVGFPNSDDIRHHVYSFSDARTFELPLYIGTPANPIVFDQAGVVDLGCNIHDFMRGYVLVVETPYYAKSDAGRAQLTALPAGELEIRVWHPRLVGEEPLSQMIDLTDDGSHELNLTLELRGELGSRRAPKRRGRRY